MYTESQLDQIEQKIDETYHKLDKSTHKKMNVVYAYTIRIVSVVILILCLYTAFVGMPGSAAVLGVLFLITWLMYLVHNIAIVMVKAALDKSKEATKDFRGLSR